VNKAFVTITLLSACLTSAAPASAETTVYIREQKCNNAVKCPPGLTCFKFPNLGARCAMPEPCNYYRCPGQTECRVAPTYPARVICEALSEKVTEPSDSKQPNPQRKQTGTSGVGQF
jgi:hypothetical protein